MAGCRMCGAFFRRVECGFLSRFGWCVVRVAWRRETERPSDEEGFEAGCQEQSPPLAGLRDQNGGHKAPYGMRARS